MYKHFALLVGMSLSLSACGEKDDPKPTAKTVTTTPTTTPPPANRTYYVTAVTIQGVTGNPTGRFRIIAFYNLRSDISVVTELYHSPTPLDALITSRQETPNVAITNGLRVIIYDATASGQRLRELGSMSINPPTQGVQFFGDGATGFTLESHY